MKNRRNGEMGMRLSRDFLLEQRDGNVGIPESVWWEGRMDEGIVIYVQPDRLCVASVL